MMTTQFQPKAPSARTKVKREHERGRYDTETIHAILDAMPLAHVGYQFNGGPVVTPTLQWREGSHVYWHGSAASRMLEHAEEAEVCLSVTLFDGMVMARSAFNHSCNYRSVMAFGRAFKVKDADKEERLRTFTEKLFPGRWQSLRPVLDKELKATTILGLELNEASAKVRTGPPNDEPGDITWPVWAGVIPLQMVVGEAQPDAHVTTRITLPDHISGYKLG